MVTVLWKGHAPASIVLSSLYYILSCFFVFLHVVPLFSYLRPSLVFNSLLCAVCAIIKWLPIIESISFYLELLTFWACQRSYVKNHNYVYLCGVKPFLNILVFLSWSSNSLHFMKPESSLPCSQQPATCPCPESAQSSSHLPNRYLYYPH
jgi:hypothetical protein